MVRRFNSALGAACLLASITIAPTAHATNYNVIVFNDFNGQHSDIEGALAAGGAITLTQGYDIGLKLSSSDDSNNTLAAGSSIAYSVGAFHHGNAVAPTISGGFTVKNGSKITGSSGFDGAAAKALYSGYSTSDAAKTANGSAVTQYGGLTLTGTNSGLNVFDIDFSSVGMLNDFSLNIPTGAYALINITRDASFQNMGFSSSAAASNVLFNFVNATSLTLSGIGFVGSILAPNADVRFDNGHMDGQLIAKSFNGDGQINYFLPDNSVFYPSTPAPEPAAWMMLIAGLGSIGVMLRRRTQMAKAALTA